MGTRLTILGCGSSGGVPRLGNNWGACDRENPKNRRRRCGLLVERSSKRGGTQVLIDTPPDLRAQLLEARVGSLDGVLFTHDHADHIHGIDELRVLTFNRKGRIDVYMDEATRRTLYTRFGYCFETPSGSRYPPILNAHLIDPPVPVVIEGGGGAIQAIPIPHEHGDITALGFRIANAAYSPDINRLCDESAALLAGLDLWIVDALRHTPHPSHFSVSEALEWIDRLKPKRAILTNLHVDLDYASLRRDLPGGVEPAYDGMQIQLD